MVGIPQRIFVVIDISWDHGEARIREIGGSRVQYVLPWDCLRFAPEQGE
ncbi:MAG: hypothetical protein V1876_01685 [Candidatus Peregrinibacteria bacterium]